MEIEICLLRHSWMIWWHKSTEFKARISHDMSDTNRTIPTSSPPPTTISGSGSGLESRVAAGPLAPPVGVRQLIWAQPHTGVTGAPATKWLSPIVSPAQAPTPSRIRREIIKIYSRALISPQWVQGDYIHFTKAGRQQNIKYRNQFWLDVRTMQKLHFETFLNIIISSKCVLFYWVNNIFSLYLFFSKTAILSQLNLKFQFRKFSFSKQFLVFQFFFLPSFSTLPF